MSGILKVSGMCLLLLVCTAAGFWKARMLERRTVRLREISACLEELLQRVRCDGSERDRLLEAAFGGRGILSVGEQGVTLLDCGIAPEDAAVLREFFAKFGAGDGETEGDRIRLCLSLLQRQREKAEQAAAERSRLYRTVGFCAGLVGCILFM